MLWGVDYDNKVDDSRKLRSSTGVNTSWISPVGPLMHLFFQKTCLKQKQMLQSLLILD